MPELIISLILSMALGVVLSWFMPKPSQTWIRIIVAVLCLVSVIWLTDRAYWRTIPQLSGTFDDSANTVKNKKFNCYLDLKNNGDVAIEGLEIDILGEGYEYVGMAADSFIYDQIQRTFKTDPYGMSPFYCSIDYLNPGQEIKVQIGLKRTTDFGPIDGETHLVVPFPLVLKIDAKNLSNKESHIIHIGADN